LPKCQGGGGEVARPVCLSRPLRSAAVGAGSARSPPASVRPQCQGAAQAAPGVQVGGSGPPDPCWGKVWDWVGGLARRSLRPAVPWTAGPFFHIFDRGGKMPEPSQLVLCSVVAIPRPVVFPHLVRDPPTAVLIVFSSFSHRIDRLAGVPEGTECYVVGVCWQPGFSGPFSCHLMIEWIE
jgi:hypothetical protein